MINIIRAFLGPREDTLFGGSWLNIRILMSDRLRDGTLNPSRIASFGDIALIHYLIQMRMSHTFRTHRWMPIIVGSHIVTNGDPITARKVTIHSRVVGWNGHHICVSHDWYQDGEWVLRQDMLARVLAPKKAKVTGEMILDAYGEESAYRALPDHMMYMLEHYDALKSHSKTVLEPV